ncbi:major capsid protein (plasmid) [Paenibacillus sp. JNUCC32]|uniref:major capsid protein n=1 Tax=Paenibacillus sp. JNUCC32 TaxID=2777984 RepID=UPI001788092F|nr:major capsid protein [Paenibacillus sp. JNUCC-32]QOT13727.1 major capsid protein [Paenibacillus sp. JNUCC-32]
MAGITYLEQFQKPALRGLVDATLADRNEVPTLGDRFLPDDRIFSNTFAYDIIKKSQHIGAMIGYGAEPPVVDRDAVASKMGEIAKMGLKYIATEEELLMLNQARNEGEKQAIIDRLTVKGVDLVNALLRRVDVIKMEALTKGNFSYNKNGVKVGVDFGIPAENKVALTGTAAWSDASADVIGDLLDWVDGYSTTNGKAPDVILISREVQALLLKNSVIVNEARGANSGATRVSVDELNSVLGGYGLPPVQIVTNRKVTVKDIYTGQDETIEFFPVNRVVMLSEGIGNFLYGPTVENDFQPGVVLDAYDKNEPIESVLRTVAAGFPAVEAPSLIFHADVYTP